MSGLPYRSSAPEVWGTGSQWAYTDSTVYQLVDTKLQLLHNAPQPSLFTGLQTSLPKFTAHQFIHTVHTYPPPSGSLTGPKIALHISTLPLQSTSNMKPQSYANLLGVQPQGTRGNRATHSSDQSSSAPPPNSHASPAHTALFPVHTNGNTSPSVPSSVNTSP